MHTMAHRMLTSPSNLSWAKQEAWPLLLFGAIVRLGVHDVLCRGYRSSRCLRPEQ
jgi:hypothetical protein